VLRDILPNERPKLTAVKVGGDPDAPPVNLSGLSDGELAFLRRTMLKVSTVDRETRSAATATFNGRSSKPPSI
jgi:hypothetical protein